jgi:hypothetical protein
VSRAVRKLVKAGDVDGLLASMASAQGTERAASLDGILECMGTHPDRVRSLRDAIRVACVPLARDPVPAVRSLALGIVTALRDPSAPSLAVAALSDPEPSVRTSGLIAVFHLQPPGSVGAVLRLLHDEDPWVRRFAVSAMERVGDRDAVSALSEVRDSEEDRTVREAIDDVVAILEGRRPPTPIEPFMDEPK